LLNELKSWKEGNELVPKSDSPKASPKASPTASSEKKVFYMFNADDFKPEDGWDVREAALERAALKKGGLTSMEIWHFADKNNDGAVTKTEFKYALTRSPAVQETLRLKGHQSKALKALFKAIDHDGDGVMTKEEFARVYSKGEALPPPAGHCAAAEEGGRIFDLADANGDGNLTTKELNTFIEKNANTALNEFFLSKSKTEKKRKVSDFCSAVAKLDGVGKTAHGSVHVSREDFVRAYTTSIAKLVKSNVK